MTTRRLAGSHDGGLGTAPARDKYNNELATPKPLNPVALLHEHEEVVRLFVRSARVHGEEHAVTEVRRTYKHAHVIEAVGHNHEHGWSGESSKVTKQTPWPADKYAGVSIETVTRRGAGFGTT